MNRIIRTFAVAIIIVWVVSPAWAQRNQPAWVTKTLGGEPCGDYRDVVEWLKEERGEKRVFRGQRGIGSVLEIYTNPRTPTWTTIISSTIGERLTCIGAYGEKWKRW